MKYELVVLVVSTLVFFHSINRFPLKNWDEAWYGEITKNMVNGKSLLVPYWNGRYYFDKPPLYFWFSYPFFKAFGPGEWQQRIPTATSATLTVILIFLIARNLFTQKVGILSIIAFISLGHVVGRFSEGDLDALMTLFLLLSFYLWLLSKGTKNLLTTLSGVSLGLAILVKGWIFALFTILLIITYSVIVKKRLPRSFLTIGILTTIFTSGWYYAVGFLKFKKEFIDWYIFHPAGGNLQNLLDNFSLKYFEFFLLDFAFWLIPIICATLCIKKLSFPKINFVYPLLLTAFVYLFTLNFLNEKLDWYTLPAYPLVAVSLGYLLDKLLSAYKKTTIAVIAITLILQTLVIYKTQTRYPDRSHIGATLGKHAKEIISREDVIILDDHDFTAFLFYSNHGSVYELSEKGGKDWEWWTLKYSDLPEFSKKHSRVWIISKNLPTTIDYSKTVDSHFDYKFGKVY